MRLTVFSISWLADLKDIVKYELVWSKEWWMDGMNEERNEEQ